MPGANTGSRYFRDIEPIIDAASAMHLEQEIEVAHPRISFEVRKTPKTGFHNLRVARVLEVRDKTIIFDETFAPPTLVARIAPDRYEQHVALRAALAQLVEQDPLINIRSEPSGELAVSLYGEVQKEVIEATLAAARTAGPDKVRPTACRSKS